MVDATKRPSDEAFDTLFGEVKQYWGWMLATGLLFIILGIIGLGMTFALTVVSVMFFGIILVRITGECESDGSLGVH